MDSTEIPVYGQKEQSNCLQRPPHPLLLFNSEGECLAEKLRPGSVHSAEG